jgi:hypothetical protein
LDADGNYVKEEKKRVGVVERKLTCFMQRTEQGTELSLVSLALKKYLLGKSPWGK